MPNDQLDSIEISRIFGVVSFLIFAIAGSLTRLHVTNFQTRVQIIGFWIAAWLVQIVVRRCRIIRLSELSFMLNGAAATIAIVATKFGLEGLPMILRRAIGF